MMFQKRFVFLKNTLTILFYVVFFIDFKCLDNYITGYHSIMTVITNDQTSCSQNMPRDSKLTYHIDTRISDL